MNGHWIRLLLVPVLLLLGSTAWAGAMIQASIGSQKFSFLPPAVQATVTASAVGGAE